MDRKISVNYLKLDIVSLDIRLWTIWAKNSLRGMFCRTVDCEGPFVFHAQ
jgi:hypothetical protein